MGCINLSSVKSTFENHAASAFDSSSQVGNGTDRQTPSSPYQARHLSDIAVVRVRVDWIKVNLSFDFAAAQEPFDLHPQEINLRLHPPLNRNRRGFALS